MGYRTNATVDLAVHLLKIAYGILIPDLFSPKRDQGVRASRDVFAENVSIPKDCTSLPWTAHLVLWED